MRVNLNSSCGACGIRGYGFGSVRARQIDRGVVAEQALLMQPTAQTISCPEGQEWTSEGCAQVMDVSGSSSTPKSNTGLWALVALAVVGAIVFSQS